MSYNRPVYVYWELGMKPIGAVTLFALQATPPRRWFGVQIDEGTASY